MEAQFWHDRWESGQTGWQQNEINAHLSEFWPSLSMKDGSTVFVPLCGKTKDLFYLLEQGHRVTGVELSEIAVTALFQENNLRAQKTEINRFHKWQCDELVLLQGDFFNLSPEILGPVNSVYDRASLIALPPEMRKRYADHMKSLLNPGASILMVTLEYDQKITGGPPFSVHREEVEDLYGDRFEIELLLDLDALEENPQFITRGVNELHEKVYLLKKKSI